MSLLTSVQQQTRYPDEILIIDGSKDDRTEVRFRESEIGKINYHKVTEIDRGLTKQRNYGIEQVSRDTDIVAFLDDDVILQPDYFEKLLQTYEIHPAAVGVGGYITNEILWQETKSVNPRDLNYFYFDGYRRKESSRYKLRRRLGLVQQTPPGVYPTFGHGRSISFLPPSGKTYQVNQLMGGVSSFPLSLLKEHKFSEYFEGYGLYEDAHFTLRVSKIGNLYLNTAAQLEHHHDPGGRPNLFNYGKMVVRNGWLVWRTFNPVPNWNDRYKWWVITILLAVIRFLNICTTRDRSGSFQEFSGRVIGMFTLLLNKPKN
ncbi:glycosyl transferase, family 2 [Nonlabens marinus S1-08]|uniref:Glycosyl transferase, family 2 n=2 Tax=Nonlabens TaxID=363408 RepID=W8W058_9FLAO|nr:glycosyl transferase, family 2 [Nonlabens marinus S1-08]